MESIKYHGRIKNYLLLPIYMIFVFVLGDIILFLYNFSLGKAIAVFVVIYAILTIIFYKINLARFESDIVNFAINYNGVNKEILTRFKVPYAVLDDHSRFIWMNDDFARLANIDSEYTKSITTIFEQITKEAIDAIEPGESKELHIEHDGRKYCAMLQPVELESEDDILQTDLSTKLLSLNKLTTVLLYDETDYVSIANELDGQKLIQGLIYIDNAEELFEGVDVSKQTMLLALIERRIAKYFENVDGLFRRIEKDKFMVFFEKKYLSKIEESGFEILEDVKQIKIGNEIEPTISIGIGYGGETYGKNANFARVAIDMALARGGSQAVIKNNNDVSYYGSRGKEIEKNTRVKARVKAQALREVMETKDNVIIMGHTIADADCLGAAVGVYCAAREIEKKVNIVLNTVTSSMRPLVDSFLENDDYPEDMFISNDKALELVGPNTLIMVVDTNRPSIVECQELLKSNRDIVVIDHHRASEEAISNPVLSYIEPYASSASEMIAEMLQYFSEKIEINATEADCIFAGILIDTNNFLTKTGVRTFEAAAFLRRNGAEVSRVRKMLREDMDAYKAKAEAIRRAEVYRDMFAISICESSDVESPTVVGAKTSNELLNIIGIKASFVLTFYNGRTYVSARSIDEIDVHSIMERLGGGGHLNVAGAQIDDTPEAVKMKIQEILDEMLEKGDIKL